MNLGESFRTALDSLNANKLRSILTMLGVIIGVSAVIALLGLGNGFSASIEDEIAGIGSNLIFVSTNFENSDDLPALSLEDVDALTAPGRAPDIVAVGAASGYRLEVIANGKDFTASVNGSTPNYFDIFNMRDDLASGSFFTEFDNESRSRVVIIGWEVADTLFGDQYPIGETVKIAGVSYEVVGVFAESEGGGIGLNPDSEVYMPLATAHTRLGTSRTRSGKIAVNQIVTSASSSSASEDAINQLTEVLREEHDIAYASDDDFEIISQADLLNSVGSILGTATLFVGIVAGISLLVGGIGIMNIMLVSVTERTREIGIRKSLGALRRDILTQFMIESLFLSLIGGVIGIVLGYGFAKIGESFADFTAQITISSIALAVGFSVAVGLIFGIYPAWRAARLRPIDALRYE